MIHYLLPFLAVVLGFTTVYFLKPQKPKQIKILLSFSGGFLLATTIFNLFPEVYEHSANMKTTGLFIVGGMLIQIFLEYFSKGTEHGHVHHSKAEDSFPFLLFGSLFIHAFLEGFPIHEGHEILLGVLIHKIPVAMILATFLLKSNFSKKQITLFLLLFAIATPLGSFAATHFSFLMEYYQQINALVVGIFLHISTTILFESSEGHKYNIAKLISILSAITIAYFI